MLLPFLVAIVSATGTLAQICAAPSVFVTVNPANNNVVVRSGTSALVEANGVATFLTCATGLVQATATATLDGGAVAASGNFGNRGQATIYVLSSANLVAPRTAVIYAAPGATVSLSDGNRYGLFLASGASGYATLGFQNTYSLTSATATLLAVNSASISQSAGQVLVDAPGFRGANFYYQGSGSLTATIDDTNIVALSPAVSAPFQVTVVGNNNRLSPGNGNTLSASGSIGYNVYLRYPNVETTLAAPEVTITAYSSVTATITSGWRGEATTNGVLDILSGGYGEVRSGRGLFRSGAGGIVRGDATATLEPGATIYAYTYASTRQTLVGGIVSTVTYTPTITGVPGYTAVAVTTTTEGGVYTFYRAERAFGSGDGLRRRMPRATPLACPPGRQSCPSQHGHLSCYDTSKDLTNCGGCSFGPNPRGVDCSLESLADTGQARCERGICVFEGE